VLLPIVLAGLVVSNSSQDVADQTELRRLFSLPDDAQILHYEGFPSTMGFGQREGLRISARYKLTPEQVARWSENARSNGWQELPIPPDVKRRMAAFRVEGFGDVEKGFYLCQTAGNNVLHATSTKQCAAVEKQNDIILGVLDALTGEMNTMVQSSY